MLSLRCGILTSLLPFLLLPLLSFTAALDTTKKASPWLTLDGNQPLVVAKGGLSGVFPDSSEYAYSFAMQTSAPDVVLWCDLQLTKDGFGICLSDMKLDNCTVISSVFENETKTYLVNGEPVSGMFSVDYTLNQLSKVPLVQGIFSRTEKFDGMLPILTVEYLASLKPPGIWLNVQNSKQVPRAKRTKKRKASTDYHQTRNKKILLLMDRERQKIEWRGIKRKRYLQGSFSERLELGPPSCVCEGCGAIMWLEERIERLGVTNPRLNLCCSNGKIKIPLLPRTLDLLSYLLTSVEDFGKNYYAY